MWALWIIIGMIPGIILGFFIGRPKKKKKEIDKYLRRGLMDRSYSMSNSYGKSENFEVAFEVGESERTDKKSKIYVVECHVSASQYSDDSSVSKIKKMVDGTWVNSGDIEWITPHTADVRNDKLDKILN